MQLPLKGFVTLVFKPVGDDNLGECLGVMDFEGFPAGQPRDDFVAALSFHLFQHFMQAPRKGSDVAKARSGNDTN